MKIMKLKAFGIFCLSFFMTTAMSSCDNDEIAGIIGSTTDGVKSSYHIAKDKIVKYMNANN